MGRPKKTTRQSKKAVIYLTPEEKKKLARKVSASGLSESLFLRSIVQRIVAGESVA